MHFELPPEVTGLAAALGIGLLIGLERERRKADRGHAGAAGIRTFALTALLGALGVLAGGEATLVALALVVGLLATASYVRAKEKDPGLTTEVALVLAFLLGAVAMRMPALAGAIGVVVTIMLAARSRMHEFVKQVITEDEMRDGLLLAAAAMVILPLTPDHAIDPFGVFNPRTLWTLVVLMMAINAAGYIALRALGPRWGLSFSGLASGFVSSSATIAAMGSRATKSPELRPGVVAGAVLSSVATVIQLAIVLGAISFEVLRAATMPLLCAGAVAVAYGAVYAAISLRMKAKDMEPGRAFDPKVALIFAATITAVLMIAAVVNEALGNAGVWLTTALAGFADAHAAAAAAAQMAAGGKLDAASAVIPILLGFTTNSITKIVVAFTTGGWAFARHVVPGVVLMAIAAWLGASSSAMV
jgi:uncharacterized membrane protein (DUF4010 family)